MKVAIGTTVLAAGTLGGEPARLISAAGTKQVQVSMRLRADKAVLFGRGGRAYVDVVEADYSYSTPQLAKAGILARRIAALSATGSLVYGTGDDSTAVGPGEVRQVDLVEWTGCGFTLRYEIVAVES